MIIMMQKLVMIKMIHVKVNERVLIVIICKCVYRCIYKFYNLSLQDERNDSFMKELLNQDRLSILGELQEQKQRAAQEVPALQVCIVDFASDFTSR